MRFGKDRKYIKQEDGSYVPEDKPDSAGEVIRRTTESVRFELSQWEVVHITAGHEPGEREPFMLQRDDPGSSYLRCLLENEDRNFHVINEDGVKPIFEPIELRLFPLNTNEIGIEGRLTHYPRWVSTYDEHIFEERISATLGVPAERFRWFLDHLRLPGVRVQITLHMQVYKEQIALSFDQPWMSQDFAVEYEGTSQITQYYLVAMEGPGIPEDGTPGEEPGDEYEESLEESEAPEIARTPDTSIAVSPHGISIGQRLVLIVAALLLALFAASGATSYDGDQRLATFNFLAAVACLFLAVRRSR